MATGRHAEESDRSFAASLIRHGAAAVALVLVVSAAFWGIGQIQPGTDDANQGATPSEDQEAQSEPATPESPTDTVEPVDEPTNSVSPTENDTPDETPEQPAPTEPEPAATVDEPAIPPGEISIQVLDAAYDPGAVAAHGVADRLSADGYNVVVVNSASRRYEQTTVMFSAGHEQEARQIAAEYGFAAVQPKPDNLSDSVDVHLVVGTDEL